jgi:membrane protease YdiL (CAAX protease family)
MDIFQKRLLMPRHDYQILLKNSHWVVLSYAVFGMALTYRKNYFGELPDALLFYLALPVCIILLLKGRLRDHGIALGDWKQGLRWTLVFIALSIATTWFSVRSIPGIRQYYRGEIFGPALIVHTIAYMAAWEFFFRGFMLFGLRKFGFAAANVLQTLLFFFMHFGKPAPELYSTLVTGLIFGYLTWRCRSVLPMIIIHSTIMLSVVYFAKM